ncbi:MAG: hypothetical protein H0T08_05800 [Acidobacteria bacterium]|jgi:hypothetical protein|nr:hypothetical protein [Acidobacteriota bacterium]
MKFFLSVVLSILLFVPMTNAQTTEVTVSLNEQFFETLLDAIFKNFNAPEFPLAQRNSNLQNTASETSAVTRQFSNRIRVSSTFSETLRLNPEGCKETIRLLREGSGVKTAVRFRDGKIYAPFAFAGSYNPPFIGCIDFAGLAETSIDIEYVAQSQKLLGRVRVLNVQLDGTGGVGSSLISKLVQNSIDKKINPIEILPINKLSFVVPMQNAGGSLKMNASGIRHEVANGVLNLHIAYQFSKTN